MIRDHPADAARALATELDADLAIGGEATERALAKLRRASGPTVAAPTVASGSDFEALGQAMRRADEVRERTRSHVADALSRTINTALAIHPDTLHRAAAELIVARADLGRAREGRAPGHTRVARRVRAGGSGGITVAGVALVVLGVPPVGLAVTAVGVVSGGAGWQAGRVATRRAVPVLEAAEGVARRRWEQLAGTDADPTEVEAVVRRYDPQHRLVVDLLVHNPAVRAADQVAAQRRLAWVEAWRDEIGDGPPPVPVVGPTARADQARRQIAAPAPATGGEPAGTLVVAAPYGDLSEDRARALHRRLLALPPGNRVIVVLGPESVGAEAPVVDLRDGPLDLTDTVPEDEPAVDAPAADPAPAGALADGEPRSTGAPAPLHHQL